MFVALWCVCYFVVCLVAGLTVLITYVWVFGLAAVGCLLSVEFVIILLVCLFD